MARAKGRLRRDHEHIKNKLCLCGRLQVQLDNVIGSRSPGEPCRVERAVCLRKVSLGGLEEEKQGF